MNSFLQHKWSWSGLMLALAAVFILVPTSTALAHPNEQSANIQSNETKLDAAYFSNNGTLDGLIVTDSGLAVADGSSTGFYTSAEIETSLQSVSDIVPLWKANLVDDSGLVIETRLRTADGAWSAWEANPYAYYPVRNEEYSGNIIWVGGQKVAVQVRVTLSNGSTLENLTLFFNDASEGPTDGEIAVQMAGVEIASGDSCPVGQPAIVSRTTWGNPKGQNSGLAPQYAPVTHIIVHHSETPLSQDYAAIVRSIWNFHTNILWWGDVGYNYMIDPNGVIYEGRAGGHDANGNYTRNAADGDVIGIHDGLNKNSMSIGLLGCYGECDDPRLPVSEPTDSMRDSAVNLMAWKFDALQIDPSSKATYNGLADISVIAGGKDVSKTTSPGPNIYNKLPDWRGRVGERTPCQQPTPTVTTTPTPSDEVTPTPTLSPSTPTVTPAPQACQITDVAFDKVQYTVGETINVRVKLADANAQPLVGANIDVTVDKTVAAQSFNEIPFLDKTGVYEGSFSNTDVAGSYNFSFRASDPTGTRFAPCTAEKPVLVVAKATVEPTIEPTVINPTTTPTAGGPTITPTVDSPTVTPTMTPTVDDPAPTPTITPTVGGPTPTPVVTVNNSLGFNPVCVESGNMVLQIANAVDVRGVDLEIVFDPSVGQVGSVTPNSAFGVVALNEIDNTNGIIRFAGTVLGNNVISNTADLLTINWSSISNGPAQVRVQNLTFIDDNDVRITVAAGIVDAGFISNSCTNITAGTVILQGKSDYSGVTVTTAGGQQIQTNARGEFTLINDTVASVSYPGYLSGEATRSTGVEVTAQGSTVRRVGSMTLLAGDTNSDNTVNIFDMTYIASRFNTSDTSGDLTGDGVINIFDLSLAAGNYNAQGPLTEWQ